MIARAIVLVPLLTAASASAQSFDAASIKPCKTADGVMRGGGNSSPGRLNTGCDLLVDENNLGLIQRAYVRFAGGHTNPMGVVPIEGGPSWLRSEMYRIDARAAGHPSLETMQGPMLQRLLEDRFRLKIRRVTRDGPVYALTASKGAAKLRASAAGNCAPMPLTIPPPAPPPGQCFCKSFVGLGSPPAVVAEGATLAEFGKLLNLVLDRPVVDRTGIEGRFDIRLEFARDDATPGLRGAPGGAATPDLPTIFTAIQEQLGLKLVPATGPVEALVIDHVERPSAN